MKIKMKSIGYIVPYFGKLPKGFELWLVGCKTNPSIDWILITNDKTQYDYPSNVKVHYCEFEEVKTRIQNHFDFEVSINTPWTLSFFKPAYGEIFRKELEKYDFWGHCDIDVLWGNIRKFITEDVLDKYDRIGFQGHSLLYRNTQEVNSRYKTMSENFITYKDVFSGKVRYSFDENGMDTIYEYLGIDYFKEICFAHLRKYEYNFSMRFVPKDEEYKNKNQVFEWKDGTLNRVFIHNNELKKEEYMYLHFFCRPMTYKEKAHTPTSRYIIYPDVVKDFSEELSVSYVKRKSKKRKIRFFVKSIWMNRNKLTIEKINGNIQRFIKYKFK